MVVKRALFIALVIVVLMTGLPVLMGMAGMAACADCGPGVLLPMTCMAALAGVAAVLPALLRSRFRSRERLLRLALVTSVFERPPQLV